MGMRFLNASAEILIRPATSGDAADLAGLAQRVFATTYGAVIPAATLHAYLAERFTPAAFEAQIAAGSLLLASVAGDLAGYARIDRSRPPECVADRQAIELAQLYVDAPYQGSGASAKLLNATCETAPASVWLCTWKQNQRALRFYQRHGFLAVGSTAIYVYDVVFDDLVLVWIKPMSP